jgi:hypothetical protein
LVPAPVGVPVESGRIYVRRDEEATGAYEVELPLSNNVANYGIIEALLN